MSRAESDHPRLPKSGPFESSSTPDFNPETNTKLMGLYPHNVSTETQCEAEGFRRITISYDRRLCSRF